MIDKEVVLNAFINSPRKSDFINKLGLDLSHKNSIIIDNELLIYTSLIGYSKRSDISGDAFRKRWKEKQYNDYMNNPKICPNCGKIIPFEKRNNKYCCQSCGAAVTNKIRGPQSEETKQKISKSVFHGRKETTILKLQIIEECPICNKQYYPYKETSKGRIKHYKTCSNECSRKLINKQVSLKVQERINNGTFSGWKSRNIISYAEKFWINVLNNNHIDFIKEYHLDKKYFLDFYIIKNDVCIDLEIDGKQHKYEDRLIHDKIRDEYVSSKNILIYRIDWNEIKTSKGSLLMKEKIDKFLNWYNEL